MRRASVAGNITHALLAQHQHAVIAAAAAVVPPAVLLGSTHGVAVLVRVQTDGRAYIPSIGSMLTRPTPRGSSLRPADRPRGPGAVSGPHHRGRPDLLVPEQFRLVLGGLLLAAHRFPWASGSVLAGGHDGLKNRREVGAVDADDPGVDPVRLQLARRDQPSNTTFRNGEPLGGVVQSDQFSQLLCSSLLIAASCGWFVSDDDTGTGAR